MRNCFFALGTVALLLIPLPAHADQIDQSHTMFTGTGSLSQAVNDCCAFAAQTFTAVLTGQLTGVNISLLSNTISGTPATSLFPIAVSILAVSSGIPMPTTLTSAIVGPGHVPLSLFIPFPTVVAVIAGTQYAIAVHYVGAPPAGPGQGQGFWIGTTGNAYVGGSAFASFEGLTWFETDPRIGGDLFFQTYVNATQVPEPTTLLLTVIGLAAIIWRRQEKSIRGT